MSAHLDVVVEAEPDEIHLCVGSWQRDEDEHSIDPAELRARQDGATLLDLIGAADGGVEQPAALGLHDADAAKFYDFVCRTTPTNPDFLEAWSDQEMRTLWLAQCVVLDRCVLGFLEHLWPAGRREGEGGLRRLRVGQAIRRRSKRPLTLGEVVLERMVKEGASVVAYRRCREGAARSAPWSVGNLRETLQTSDEILVVEGALKARSMPHRTPEEAE